MKDNISFRVGSREDDARLVALLNETFRTPVSEDQWKWYLYGNPGGPNRVYVMQDSDNVPVGCYCVAPLWVQHDSKHCLSGFAHHLVVQPDYRAAHNFISFSRFVFEQEAYRGTAFLIGPPNKNAYQAHKVMAGWSDFAFMDCLYKPKPKSQPHDCKEVKVFSDDFGCLIKSISESHSFYFDKNASWLNWRFLACPHNPYTSFAFHESGKLQGFIVLKQWEDLDGYRKAHIMDLWASTSLAVSQLLAAAEQYSVGCDELNLWCVDGYPYRMELEGKGFIQRDSARQPIITRSLAGNTLSRPDGCWSFMYGDADGY